MTIRSNPVESLSADRVVWRPTDARPRVAREVDHLATLVGTLEGFNDRARITVGLDSLRNALVIRVNDGWIVRCAVGPASALVLREAVTAAWWFQAAKSDRYPSHVFSEAHLLPLPVQVATVAWSWVQGDVPDGFTCSPRVPPPRIRFASLDAALAHLKDWPREDLAFIKEKLGHLAPTRIVFAENQRVLRLYLADPEGLVAIFPPSSPHRPGSIHGPLGLGGYTMTLRLPSMDEGTATE